MLEIVKKVYKMIMMIVKMVKMVMIMMMMTIRMMMMIMMTMMITVMILTIFSKQILTSLFCIGINIITGYSKSTIRHCSYPEGV